MRLDRSVPRSLHVARMHLKPMQHACFTLLHCCLSARTRECARAHLLMWASAWVCVCESSFVCLCVCMRAGLCVGLRACVLTSSALCVCAFACVLAAVHCYAGGHYSRVLSGCSAGTCGTSTESTRRVLEGIIAVLKIQSRGTQGVLVLMGCTLGYLGGTPRKCVRACDAVHLLGLCGTSQQGRTTLHGSSWRTDRTGWVLDEYSRQLYVLRSIAARASAQ
jgi:hypothetical protein